MHDVEGHAYPGPPLSRSHRPPCSLRSGTHCRAYGSVDAVPPSSNRNRAILLLPPIPPPRLTLTRPRLTRLTKTPPYSPPDDHELIFSRNVHAAITHIGLAAGPDRRHSWITLSNRDQRTHPDIQVSPTAYSMVAHIGTGFSPECITISAMKGNSLVIVADRWDMEKDCRYEWLWRFDRDADMSSVYANYDAGVLRVTVKRIPGFI
ncbi:hypothetical protein RhiLY_02695 [Ceratobasidium sp. AG-Ba]|nr:hypothetical protein RhiLY_02695 [Ceratobasidium sp. AG-Ba]